MRKRDGRTIAFAYDALHRVISRTYPQGGARPVYYGYDLRNHQLFARYDSPTGEGVTSSYDGFGRLTSSTTNMGGVTRTLGYVYDRNRNRVRITHPDGNFFTATYDALSRLISETGPFGTTGYQYDLAGRRTRLTWTDGFYVAYDYLVTGEISAIRENGATSGAGVLGTYAWAGH